MSKPDPGFFSRVIEMAPGLPEEIAYVGDHRDLDVVAARKAGLRTVLIRRGPWGHLWAEDRVAQVHADWVIEALEELPLMLAEG